MAVLKGRQTGGTAQADVTAILPPYQLCSEAKARQRRPPGLRFLWPAVCGNDVFMMAAPITTAAVASEPTPAADRATARRRARGTSVAVHVRHPAVCALSAARLPAGPVARACGGAAVRGCHRPASGRPDLLAHGSRRRGARGAGARRSGRRSHRGGVRRNRRLRRLAQAAALKQEAAVSPRRFMAAMRSGEPMASRYNVVSRNNPA